MQAIDSLLYGLCVHSRVHAGEPCKASETLGLEDRIAQYFLIFIIFSLTTQTSLSAQQLLRVPVDLMPHELNQGFSTLALLTLGTRSFFVGEEGLSCALCDV